MNTSSLRIHLDFYGLLFQSNLKCREMDYGQYQELAEGFRVSCWCVSPHTGILQCVVPRGKSPFFI